MTVSQIKKAINNGDISRLYLFHGEEEFLVFSYISNIKGKVLDELADFNYFQFDGETSIDTAVEAIEQYPQMAEKKMVVFKESGLLKAHDKNMEKLLRSVPDYAVVIFVERDGSKISKKLIKIIEEQGHSVNFDRQKASDLRAWINIRLSRAGKTMSNNTTEYLVQVCDLSMSKIELELNKIISYVGDREEITQNDVERMITPILDIKIYEMVDNVLKKDRTRAHIALNEFKQNSESPSVILSVLFTQLNYIAMVMNLKGDKERSLGEFFPSNRKFLADKISRDSSRYNIQMVKRAMYKCAEYDADIKMGLIEGWTAVEIVISEIMLK